MHRSMADATEGWTPSQLVAFNLARARHKAGLTQHEAAAQISRYTATTWTQAIVATAEGTVTVGNRARQFNPTELLAFSFAFDVPIAWFFMPPPDPESHPDRVRMANHPDGIGWDRVFSRTAPTTANIDAYLHHQGHWFRNPLHATTTNAPIDATATNAPTCRAANFELDRTIFVGGRDSGDLDALVFALVRRILIGSGIDECHEDDNKAIWKLEPDDCQ